MNKKSVKKIIGESISEILKDERKKVNRKPTELQKQAGNYRMGHIRIQGFQITIENPKGSYRKGKDRNGKEWKIKMNNDYGYFTKTKGKDGDAIDVFLGPNLKSNLIYGIDQFLGGNFDETKFMLGFNSKKDAKDAYMSNYEKGWKGFGTITCVDREIFKKWLYDGYRQRKPFKDYVEIERKKLNESKKNKTLNDKGEEVPEKCPICGSKIGLYIHGEPVYLCSNKKCGKYFGTMPFNSGKKKNKTKKIDENMKSLTRKDINIIAESILKEGYYDEPEYNYPNYDKRTVIVSATYGNDEGDDSMEKEIPVVVEWPYETGYGMEREDDSPQAYHEYYDIDEPECDYIKDEIEKNIPEELPNGYSLIDWEIMDYED